MALQLSGTSGVPPYALPFLVGQVCFFAMQTPPPGFVVLDGSELSRTGHATLFTAIGTLYGVGNGTTTFNLPDLRGEFIRGWDNGRGVDAGRVFGGFQADEFKSHTHTLQDNAEPDGDTPGRFDAGGGSQPMSEIVTTGATGGSETRPRNVALLPCIFVGV